MVGTWEYTLYYWGLIKVLSVGCVSSSLSPSSLPGLFNLQLVKSRCQGGENLVQNDGAESPDPMLSSRENRQRVPAGFPFPELCVAGFLWVH